CDDGDAALLTAPAERVAVDAVLIDEVARLRSRSTVPVAVDIAVSEREAGVAGREEHLARVVRNLLENAARHARTRVTVTLTSAPAAGGENGSAAGGGELELVVADDGPGIDPADRARVFDRFTRLDDARSRDEGGSGLGLPIAREIVEAHGGRLIVRLPQAPALSGAGGGQLEDEPGAGRGGFEGDASAVGDGDVAHDG